MKRVNVENFILFYLFIHLFITRSTRLLYRRKISIEIKKKGGNIYTFHRF